MKYPEIADYKQSIRELDEKEYINMRLCAIDLRNNYAILVRTMYMLSRLYDNFFFLSSYLFDFFCGDVDIDNKYSC